ncbi:hypothetical protein ACFLYB_06330, partial [Chloroflexota bacterium]
MERKGTWIKGKSPYPKSGRPRGQNTLEAYYRDHRLFELRHKCWSSFALEYIVTVGNGAEAARRVGYSPEIRSLYRIQIDKKPSSKSDNEGPV